MIRLAFVAMIASALCSCYDYVDELEMEYGDHCNVVYCDGVRHDYDNHRNGGRR